MTITELLRTEHAAFNAILDEIETALPSAATLGELRILVNLIAGFLQQHGHKEEEILCPALDQMQGQRGQMEELTQEHGELDQQIRQVAKNRDLKNARQQLGQLIQAVRQHFDHEERQLFPLAEEVLLAENLAALGSAAEETARQMLAHNRGRGQRLQDGHVTTAGHDHVGRGSGPERQPRPVG
jgi:hemerythrin-like domain-containing protein